MKSFAGLVSRKQLFQISIRKLLGQLISKLQLATRKSFFNFFIFSEKLKIQEKNVTFKIETKTKREKQNKKKIKKILLAKLS